jgi:predicted transglutaminase-like cysteine proteinase
MARLKALIAASIAVGMTFLILLMPAKAASIDFSNPAFAPVGGLTSIPIGAAQFCKTHRGECTSLATLEAAVPLTQRLWDQLIDVNNAINAAIVPVTDEQLYKVSEYWTYPDGAGDCEDFALAKRKALISEGWNPSTLMIAVVKQQNGEGHAVLMVRTDRGDLVLDNQESQVLVWNETPYHFLKRQSQADAGKWVDLVDGRGRQTASR